MPTFRVIAVELNTAVTVAASGTSGVFILYTMSPGLTPAAIKSPVPGVILTAVPVDVFVPDARTLSVGISALLVIASLSARLG